MSTTTVSLNEIAAQWRAARRIYPIYALIVRQSEVGLEPCRDLESPIDRNDAEVLARIAKWFDDVDGRSRPEHLRNALQVGHVAKEESLRGVLRRFLDKKTKTAADRDKIDFLLVQYFSQCAPHSMHNRELDLDDVSQVLEPVLGETVPHQPRWLDVLDDELKVLSECRSLAELLEKKVLVNVRHLKEQAGEDYYTPGAMLGFARFNFMARHAFFRLLHADLNTMRHALQELEKRNLQTLDCSAAGLSKTEKLETIHRICHDWKTPFRAPYAAGKPFEPMTKVLPVLTAALAAPPPVAPKVEVKPAPPAPAAQAPAPAPKPQNPQPKQTTQPPAPVPGPSTHEVALETAEGKIPTAIMEAVKQSNAQGPSTSEIPVYAAQEQPAAPAGTPDVLTCLEHIAEQLIGHEQELPTSVATVFYQQSKILLSSWEVAAFTKGGNDAADALQRAVAARSILLEVVERKKKGIAAPDLTAALKLAHAEVGLLQEAIAQAKDAKNIDGAVNLAATTKRLLALIDETEKQAK